jgi:hypothetical protein
MDPRGWRIRGIRRAAAPEGKGIRCDGIPFPNTSDVHDVDEVIRRYARAAGELWKFCWSGGSGSHLVFVARTLELWADEADQVDWWKKRRGVAGAVNARAICAAARG